MKPSDQNTQEQTEKLIPDEDLEPQQKNLESAPVSKSQSEISVNENEIITVNAEKEEIKISNSNENIITNDVQEVKNISNVPNSNENIIVNEEQQVNNVPNEKQQVNHVPNEEPKLKNLGSKPVLINCPYCQKTVISVLEYKINCIKLTLFILLFIAFIVVGGIIGIGTYCWSDIYHVCPKCGKRIGKDNTCC